MSMTKRNGVYVADLRQFGGKRVSLHTGDPEIAKDRYRDAVRKLDGGPRGDGKLTLGEAYRATCQNTDWATAKDQAGIGSRWKMVAEYYGEGTLLSSVDRKSMTEFTGWLRKKKRDKTVPSNKTINRYLALLSKVLRHHADNGTIPMPAVPWLDVVTGGRIRWYTREEEAAIRDHFLGQGDRAMNDLVVFLCDTGFRLGEALSAFRVEGQSAVLDDQKGGRRTATPLTDRAYHVAVSRQWSGLTGDQVDKRWAKMRTALKLDATANVHACRHTTATRLAAAGRPVNEIQMFMRHADVRTTMIYVHLAAGQLQSAVSALEECAIGVPQNRLRVVGGTH